MRCFLLLVIILFIGQVCAFHAPHRIIARHPSRANLPLLQQQPSVLQQRKTAFTLKGFESAILGSKAATLGSLAVLLAALYT
eukprot:scaffold139_cov260-Ochromonas_danica.AAC.6